MKRKAVIDPSINTGFAVINQRFIIFLCYEIHVQLLFLQVMADDQGL